MDGDYTVTGYEGGEYVEEYFDTLTEAKKRARGLAKGGEVACIDWSNGVTDEWRSWEARPDGSIKRVE